MPRSSPDKLVAILKRAQDLSDDLYRELARANASAATLAIANAVNQNIGAACLAVKPPPKRPRS